MPRFALANESLCVLAIVAAVVAFGLRMDASADHCAATHDPWMCSTMAGDRP